MRLIKNQSVYRVCLLLRHSICEMGKRRNPGRKSSLAVEHGKAAGIDTLLEKNAMVEKEPHVKPAIRLPQLPTKGARTTRNLEMHPEADAGAPEAASKALVAWQGEAPEEDWADDMPDQPLRSQISGDQPSLSGDTSGMRSPVSSLLRRALLNFAEQERQRARMLEILLLAQAVALVLILPGYLFGQFQLSGLLVVLGGLVVLSVVWLLHWLKRTAEACYLLVLGGGGFVVLDLLLSAGHLLTLDTLHISLLFLLVILSSGILFSPETALILSIISSLFTALVLLLFHPSPALAALFDVQGRYLAIVYLVIAQLGVGVVAWVFGRQMQESTHLITYVAGLEMANKRLHKRLRQTAEKKRSLESGLAIIQQTHARVAAGDYSARAHVEGDLLPLSVSLNLMLERVESFVHGEHERELMETAAAGLAEMAGKVGQESMGQLPVPTGTALDGVSIAIKNMQSTVNQRLSRVQQAVTSLMTTVDRCQDGLQPVAEVLEEHLRSIDALALAADNVMNSAQRQVELAGRAEALLHSSVPAGVDLKTVAGADQAEKKGTSALRMAEELERLVARIRESVEPAEVAEAAPDESALPVQAPPDAEPEITSDAEVANTSEAPSQDEVAEPASEAEQEGQDVGMVEEGYEEASASAQATEQPSDTTIESANEEEVSTEATEPVSEASEPSRAEEASSEIDDQSESKSDVLTVDELEIGEEVLSQEPDWNVAQLQELARMLSYMAGEATLQERNARTMNYKLVALLQGQPNTRGVDMLAAWLRTALEAVTQAANQVRQASKSLPASAFAGPKDDSAEPDGHM
jgi:hypothetical protein